MRGLFYVFGYAKKGSFMDDLTKQKLAMWKKQEEDLQKQLAETMQARGKAAQEGDLSENAAYKDYTEKSEMLSAQIASVQKIIADLEGGASGNS